MANPRRTHRKRISALRLSSDTTNTLPEYWRELVPPPEYEADADGDADDDTDGDNEPPAPYIPPGAVSPRRRMQHRRKPSSPLPQDAFIDSLLERSVHALELSNALLQSSMTPTTSAFKDPSPTKSTPAPIPMPPARDESWAEDLAKIAQDVDELLVSSSLPPAPSPIAHRRPRRRPSLDTTTTSSRRSSYLSSSSASSAMPTTSHASDNGLRMAGQTRSRFIAHAPRAMTQYIDAETAHDDLDEETISLPSTLGLRAAASDWRIAESKPVVSTTTHSPEPSTPAYHMLSSFVHPRATSPKIATGPRSSSRGRAATRGGSRSSSRGGSHTPRRTGTPDGLPLPESSSPLLGQRSSPGSVSGYNGPHTDTSSTFTTHSNLSASIIARLPSETLGHSPQSSDDGGDGSADGCRAKEARSALRRILEEAPPPPPPVRSASRKFQPRTPPPLAHAASSTATASVSRLFSKGGRHSVSTPPERVVGIMKRSSVPGTPTAATADDKGEGTSTSKGIGSVFWISATSRPGSGASTPRSAKRISFAELPESYAGSRPGGAGSSSLGKGKARRKSKTRSGSKTRKGKGKGRSEDGTEEDGSEEKEGWLSWLVGGSALGLGLGLGGGLGATYEDRDRNGVGGASARALWGGSGAGGLSRSASDEWAV